MNTLSLTLWPQCSQSGRPEFMNVSVAQSWHHQQTYRKKTHVINSTVRIWRNGRRWVRNWTGIVCNPPQRAFPGALALVRGKYVLIYCPLLAVTIFAVRSGPGTEDTHARQNVFLVVWKYQFNSFQRIPEAVNIGKMYIHVFRYVCKLNNQTKCLWPSQGLRIFQSCDYIQRMSTHFGHACLRHIRREDRKIMRHIKAASSRHDVEINTLACSPYLLFSLSSD